jgi:hypothetical protein
MFPDGDDGQSVRLKQEIDMTTLDAVRFLSDEDLAAVSGGRMHLIGPPPERQPGVVPGSIGKPGFADGLIVGGVLGVMAEAILCGAVFL